MSLLPLSASSLRQLVALRRRAMSGGAVAALAEFPVLTPATPAADRVALACLRAEILHLDGRDDESLTVFDTEIEPRLPDLPPAARVELLENKSSVLRSAWRGDGLHLFYQMVDRRTLLDHPTRDYRRIVMADDAASRGKHYDALPDYWAELRQAYAGLSWRRRAFAHGDFARECLALDRAPQAWYHIMLAERRDLLDHLVEKLARANSPAAVSSVVRLALAACGLARHAAHTVRLIAKVTDLLPEADLAVVAARLLAWAALPVASPAAGHCFEPTWEAIAQLAPQLDAAQAENFITLAVNHAGFAGPMRARGPMLKAIHPLLARVRPEYAAAIAPRLVAPATDQKSDVDYADALNALCRAVVRSGDEKIKSTIADRLYPPGQPISDAYLLQVAPVFGWNTRDRAQFNQAALEAAAAVRKQVERLPPGSEPAKIGGYGTIQTTIEGRTLVVHWHGAQHWIDGVLANKQFLDPTTADALAAALADTAADDDNTVVNRYTLIASLRELADVITEPAAADCVAKLRRIAAGTFSESAVTMSHAEAANVLNPFKMAQGDPAQLQGVALRALADLAARTAAAASALRDDGLLTTAMSDPRPTVRAHAAAAARALPTLTADEVNALLLLTTDANADTAATALFAFRDAQRLELNRPQLALLLSFLERAAMRPEPPVRRAVAQVVGGLLNVEIIAKLRARREALRSRLAADPAHSVRSGLDTQQQSKA